MKINTLITTTLLAVLLLGGCAGLKPPSISVADIEVIEVGLFEQRLAIRLRVQNPNKVEIPINGLSFEVELNGEPFATGVSDKAIKVPRLGEAVLEVNVVTGFAGILRQIQILSRGNVDAIPYRIKGRLMIGSYGMDFDEGGRLEMPKKDAGQ